MNSGIKYILLMIFLSILSSNTLAQEVKGMISGKILSIDGDPVDCATIYLKGTSISGQTNEKGLYHISAPAGDYNLQISSVGFEKAETKASVIGGRRTKLNVKLKPSTQLAEVIVVGSQLSKVRNSAFNATAVNTQELVNSTKTLSEALAKAPVMKIRE
ncbi:MAG: carboxypeptidase-like regulatory domain-containing protein, partial [Muribaculaceae bacterium]|nr:carboxypeptidase-like regulatory domain-containing protein [Muribaculaceae bacterium]